MIHKHIKTLPHHPKRVIVISLIVALALGTFGYIQINKKPAGLTAEDQNANLGTEQSENNILSLGFLAGGRIKTVSVKAGDTVKAGQVLAALDSENTLGALAQTKAALEAAQANYKKIINGATGAAIDVAKAAVNTAQVNLDGVSKQQNILVSNAHANLLNSTLTANLLNSDNPMTPPSISGTYAKDAEGVITFSINQAGSGGYATFSGLVNSTTAASTTTPEPIGDSGLYIEFNSIAPYIGTTWQINIPNKSAPNYLANYNAYQSALQNQNQMVGNAQATLDQANASLAALAAAARPEDVAVAQAAVGSAQGAVQIAEANYENTVIIAPADGTIVSVAIAPGQIATSNAPAIEFTSSDALKGSESRP